MQVLLTQSARSAAWKHWLLLGGGEGEGEEGSGRRLETAKLTAQFLKVEKWEVTKARLLLLREEMFLALTVHSAFLTAAARCWGPCPGADATAAQAESENPFFPSSRFAAAAGEA